MSLLIFIKLLIQIMDHIAIMNKKWKLIDKILSGEKIIESRWYKNKISPWNKVKVGDRIFFKDSGEDVTAKAVVSQVQQFENLDEELVRKIIRDYGDKISLQNTNYKEWIGEKRYCILIWIKDAVEVKPFAINKKGFGNAAAWIAIDDINKIKEVN